MTLDVISASGCGSVWRNIIVVVGLDLSETETAVCSRR